MRRALLVGLVLSLPSVGVLSCSKGSPPPSDQSGIATAKLGSVDTAASAPPALDEAQPATLSAARVVAAARPEPAKGEALSSLGAETSPGSMLVRTGRATVLVDSLERAMAGVRAVATRTNAIVANTSVDAGQEQNHSASLELRVPAERFDEALDALRGIGRVEAVNVSAEDVGEEFVDVQARVANARRLEERLIALLATRTGKLSDVLHVEQELSRVREEIERYEGRLRYLRTRAAVSSLTVVVHEPAPLVASHPGDHPIGHAFLQAWRNLVSVTATLIAALGVVIPLGIVMLGVVWLGRRVSKHLGRTPLATPRS